MPVLPREGRNARRSRSRDNSSLRACQCAGMGLFLDHDAASVVSTLSYCDGSLSVSGVGSDYRICHILQRWQKLFYVYVPLGERRC